jgi:hypothetical protein
VDRTFATAYSVRRPPLNPIALSSFAGKVGASGSSKWPALSAPSAPFAPIVPKISTVSSRLVSTRGTLLTRVQRLPKLLLRHFLLKHTQDSRFEVRNPINKIVTRAFGGHATSCRRYMGEDLSETWRSRPSTDPVPQSRPSPSRHGQDSRFAAILGLIRVIYSVFNRNSASRCMCIDSDRMARGPAVRVTAAMNPREPMVSSPKA